MRLPLRILRMRETTPRPQMQMVRWRGDTTVAAAGIAVMVPALLVAARQSAFAG
jgi:hypothetical protein